MAESLQNLKRRLSGVQNINQITRAMELVAATKMRKSQDIALASRPYAYAALDLLARLTTLDGVELPKLLEKRDVQHTATVVITSDKGLAGSFNSAVIREVDKFFHAHPEITKEDNHFVAIGQKAANYLEKRMKVCEKFIRVGDYTTIEEVRPIAELLVEGYLKEEWDRVVVISTNFKSALTQTVVRREFFPVDIERIREVAREIIPETGRYAELREQLSKSNIQPTDYIIEPSPKAVLEGLARHLALLEIYHLILEANASEHAARRVAMKSASDNAEELADDLSMEYNKSRQALITREIVEIVAGAEAL